MLRIWTAPVGDLIFEDIEQFVQLKIRENELVEYKSAKPKGPLGMWLCAFANHHGGLLLIGVAAKNEYPTGICGADRASLQEDGVDQEAFKCMPPLVGLCSSKVIELPGDPLKAAMVIRVEPGSPDVPYSYDGHCYVRTDGSKRRLKTQADSERVQVATTKEVIDILRRRERSESVSERVLAEVESRVDRIGGRGNRSDLVIIPDLMSSPKGDVPWEKFVDFVQNKAIFWDGHVYRPQYVKDQALSRLHNGVAVMIEGVFYFEVQRNGTIWQSWWGEDRPGWPRQPHNDGFFLSIYCGDLAKTLTYAARLYRLLGYHGTVRIKARVGGVKGRLACFERAEDPRLVPMVVDELCNEVRMPSMELMRDPMECLSRLLEDLLFPTHQDVASAIGRVEDAFHVSFERHTLCDKGVWTQAWRDCQH